MITIGSPLNHVKWEAYGIYSNSSSVLINIKVYWDHGLCIGAILNCTDF